MEQSAVPIIIAAAIVWSVGGILWFRHKFTLYPQHEESLKEILLGGPIIWLLEAFLIIYNFIVIKK